MKPTKDEKAKEAIDALMSPILFYGAKKESMKGKVGQYHLDDVTHNILVTIEQLGYERF